jgi:hypothetical protein
MRSHVVLRSNLAAAFAGALFLPSCHSRDVAPDVGTLYNRAARHHDVGRNPVIVIPGILGSRLVDGASGRVVWGAFAGDFADPGDGEGARLFALPMREGAPLRDLVDDVRPDGVLDRLKVNWLGLPLELKAYANILATLGVGGYRDEELGLSGAIDYGEDHFTCFQFPYDWRRDNVENARRLHAYVEEKRAYAAREMEKRFGVKDPEVRFDIVAHSMGGLITRYFLLYGDADLPDEGPIPPPTWEGARHVGRVVLVGTPNAGSVKSLVQLVDGVRFGPLLPTYDPAVVGNLPSVYQLLPRSRHRAVVDESDPARPIGDLFDPALWERVGWGLAAEEQDPVLRKLLPDVPDRESRRRIALDHLRKCLKRAERFAAALDAPAEPPAGLSLALYAGDAVPTPAVAAVDRRDGSVRIVEEAAGDGTVLRSSALLDERVGLEWTPHLRSPIRWSRATFLFTDHLGITQDPAFTDNVLFHLLEEPR